MPENAHLAIKSIVSADKAFTFKQEYPGLRGVEYITITTQQPNMFSQLLKCILTISVNNEVIKKLKPEMEVLPLVVVRTQILEQYYKQGKALDYIVYLNFV